MLFNHQPELTSWHESQCPSSLQGKPDTVSKARHPSPSLTSEFRPPGPARVPTSVRSRGRDGLRALVPLLRIHRRRRGRR
jgi:hypothetical protein